MLWWSQPRQAKENIWWIPFGSTHCAAQRTSCDIELSSRPEFTLLTEYSWFAHPYKRVCFVDSTHALDNVKTRLSSVGLQCFGISLLQVLNYCNVIKNVGRRHSVESVHRGSCQETSSVRSLRNPECVITSICTVYSTVIWTISYTLDWEPFVLAKNSIHVESSSDFTYVRDSQEHTEHWVLSR